MKTLVSLKSTKVDQEKRQSGAWVDSQLYPGVAYFVKSTERDEYVEAAQKRRRDDQLKFGQQELSQDMARTRVAELFADYVVFDWRGFADDDGSSLLFSRYKLVEVMTDPEYREVASDIIMAARSVGGAKIEFVQAATKNSEEPSATS